MAMSATLRRLRTSAWLGWQVDSNWTDPTVFVIYAIARPLATALILVGMYWAVRGRQHAGAAAATLFAGFYVANAFHTFVNTVMVDMGWVVFSEREEYETLRYVVASPVGMRTYLTGRAAMKFGRATVSVAIMLLLGWYALGIRWSWAHVHAGPLVLALLLGLAATLFAGLLVAGLAMVLTRNAMTVLEGLTLGLYLLCGVIFPIDLLPRVLQWISLALPFTWWYEALRRFLLGHGSSARLAHLSDGAVLGMLALVTVAACAGSWWVYGRLEHRARQLGRIDQTTLF
jgi:ABC-2 type transport system permease protein